MIRAAIDHAHHVIDDCAELAQLSGGDHDLPTCGDDVLDHGHALAHDVGAFCELCRPVGLGLLANERRGDAGTQRQGGSDRHATELQSGQHLGVVWQQRHERRGDVGEQNGIRLESVLVEVLGGDLA